MINSASINAMKSRTAPPRTSREPGFQKKVLPSSHATPSEDVRRRHGCPGDHDEKDPEPERGVRGHRLSRRTFGGPRVRPWVRAGLVPGVRPAARVVPCRGTVLVVSVVAALLLMRLRLGVLVVVVVVVVWARRLVVIVVVVPVRRAAPIVVMGSVVGVSVVVVSAVVVTVRGLDVGIRAQQGGGVSVGTLSAVEVRPRDGGEQQDGGQP